MKIRIVDRIMAALAGLALIAGCAGAIAQVFFGVNLKGRAAAFLAEHPTEGRVILIAGAVLLTAVGIYCVSILFRHRRKSERFIRQKTETGSLEISLDAMETLVRKCLEQHPELETQQLALEGRRDGLLIRITGKIAGGLSIPLTVDLLQRQIKQYVTACSGIAVRDILVQIEVSGEVMGDVPFAVEAPAGLLLLKEGEERKAEEAGREPDAKPGILPEAAAAESPEEAEKPQVFGENKEKFGAYIEEAEEDADGDDERAVHQRLFSIQDEPCVVPVPPAMDDGSLQPSQEASEAADGEPAPAEENETDGDPAPAEENETKEPDEKDPEVKGAEREQEV